MEPMQPVLPSQPQTHQLEIVFAEDQDDYRPLPAIRCEDGTVITRWGLTWWERLHLLWTGCLYLRQLTFNRALQPQLPSLVEPKVKVGG